MLSGVLTGSVVLDEGAALGNAPGTGGLVDVEKDGTGDPRRLPLPENAFAGGPWEGA
jgi:hypothetical protein